MSVKRILHITGKMDRAGAETMVMNLYYNIDRSKYQFDFVYFSKGKADFDEEIEMLGGTIYRLPFNNPVKRFFALRKFLLEHKEYSIVHAHTLLNIGFNLMAAKLAGIKNRIAHSHSTSNKKRGLVFGSAYEKISKWLIKNYSTQFIACGKEAGAYLFHKNDEFELLPNAIDTVQFANIGQLKKTYWKEELGIHSDLKIIQVGRLQDVKNHRFSVEIAKCLDEVGVDFSMLFVGQGEKEQEISQSIDGYGLTEKVKLLGVRSDIPELMAGGDIMLLPSLYEGFPVVLVEAQSVGLTSLISSTISKEVDLKFGIVHFESLENDPKNWAERINKIRSKAGLGKEERLKVLKEKGFDIKENAEKLENLYDSL